MTGTRTILPGLCSVTLRSLDVAAVAQQAATNGLTAMEWGGDVHVPPGNATAVQTARTVSADLGLSIASYGSYLTAGRISDDGEIDLVLDTAGELGAPNVRVWANGEHAAEDLQRICARAAARALTVSLEFHPGTSTETAASTKALLAVVDHPNLFTYWQPDPTLDAATARHELAAVVPHLSHLHVFSWTPDHARLALAAGAELWPAALRTVIGSPSTLPTTVAFLEFVRDDDPDQLRSDARTLIAWLAAPTVAPTG